MLVYGGLAASLGGATLIMGQTRPMSAFVGVGLGMAVTSAAMLLFDRD